jgi:hypothetical protein
MTLEKKEHVIVRNVFEEGTHGLTMSEMFLAKLIVEDIVVV